MKILFLTFSITLISLTFAQKKPNIIFIFADDIGYEALNCYGGLDFETPQLDRMAKEGRLFQHMYTSPVCTPSRVSMHTGLYTFRHKHYRVLPVHKGTKLKVDFQTMPTYAQQLKGNGYVTSVTGKWQLATMEEWPDHIKNAGFDSWCIWQIWKDGKKTGRHWNPCLNRDGTVLKGLKDKFGSDVLRDYVFERMESAVKQDKPFFILHNELLPHWPVVQTPDDRKLNREGSLKGMISYMDKLTGSILAKVEELGIRDNTYVFFMGDNGTWDKDFNNPYFGKKKGEGQHTRHTVKGPVNGGKAYMSDAGSHVPFIVWGPSSIPKNSTCDELIDVVDIFKTFCELTSTDIPDNVNTDGRSFAAQIHGKEGPSREWVHHGYKGQNLFDGSYRYFVKTGVVWDARNLPYEKVMKDNEKSRALIKRFKELYETIIAEKPQAPRPLDTYK